MIEIAKDMGMKDKYLSERFMSYFNAKQINYAGINKKQFGGTFQ